MSILFGLNDFQYFKLGQKNWFSDRYYQLFLMACEETKKLKKKNCRRKWV